MGSFENRPCLQGEVVRSDLLRLQAGGGAVPVKVLETQFKHKFVARWDTSPADPGGESVWAVATHLLVTFREPVNEAGAIEIIDVVLQQALHAVIHFAVRRIPLLNTFLVFTPEDNALSAEEPPIYLLAALAFLRLHPAIQDANPNYLYFSLPMSFSVTSGCPGAGISDDLLRIGVQRAWRRTSGDCRVRVAVLDSGIELSHSALSPNFEYRNGIVVGRNYYCPSSPPDDDEGHGTWCAGLIGATSKVGVNQRVTLIPLKFLGPSGCGEVVDAISSIQFALEESVHIISASWGAPYPSPELGRKIKAAESILFVAGAGNESRDLDKWPFYPAAFALPNILSVGGVDDADVAVPNWGFGLSRVHLSAPGTTVCSTALQGYRVGDGTSAATAYVAGACALVKAADFNRNAAAIRQRVLDSVVPLPRRPAGISCTGGRLDLANAIWGDSLGTSNCP